MRPFSLQLVVLGCAMGVHRPRRAWLGFVIGAFFSLMSSSFAYEDPLLRQSLSTQQKARAIFKEMGQGMYKSGKGFGKVGALFAGIECVIESVSSAYPFLVNDRTLCACTVSQYRARNDMVNPVAAGFVAGGILARNAGPKAVVGGGVAFAAFSAAIDLFLRRETAE